MEEIKNAMYIYIVKLLGAQVKLYKENLDSMIHHMTNDIVDKEKSALDLFITNIDNLVRKLLAC